MKPSFGIRAPSFPADVGPQVLREFAIRAERCGLDSFWLPDHPQPVSSGYYNFLRDDPVLEPLAALCHVAAVTERIFLGTGVLLAPFRHPLMLAKSAVTTQFLSQGRLILGLGTGWFPEEFTRLGIPRTERGVRTDEAIDILQLAFKGEAFDYKGRIFNFEGATINPRTDPPPRIWGAGGQGVDEYAVVGAASTLEPKVAARIARLDGWLTRPTAGVDQIKTEWAHVKRLAAELGRDPDAITLAHVNFCHLAEGSREQALAEQHEWFRRVLGEGATWERQQGLYFTGSLDDIAERVQRLMDVGVRHVVVHPLAPDVGQVDLWAQGVLGRFGVKAEAVSRDRGAQRSR